MAKGLHRRASILKSPPTFPDKGRKYVEGDWGLHKASIGLLRLADMQIEQGYDEEGDNTDSSSISSFSTNATMDDIPGPGRMLDKLYQFLGRKLERCIIHFSISSLHPNRILQCLWEDNFGWHYSDREPLHVILGRIRCGKRERGRVRGPTAIAGLESLVQQTQSNSPYRSAAALAALMRLSTTSPSFGKFFFAISNKVPIFNLEMQVTAHEDSYADKKLFLSVVALGKARLPVRDRASFNSDSMAHSLRQDLLRLFEYEQVSYQDSLLALSDTCLLLAKIRHAIEESIHGSSVESISDTTYYLFVFALINFDHALHYSEDSQHFEYLVLAICIEWFHELGWSILQWFSRSQHYPLLYKLHSPFSVIEGPRSRALFDGIYHSKGSFCLTNKVNLHWLPRSFDGDITSIFKVHIEATISRSRRLLISLDELKREVRENKPHFEYFTELWKDGLFTPSQVWKEDPELSRRRALCVHPFNKDLTRKFMRARNDSWAWIMYKEDCQQRHLWGEHLRSDMDWDWDSGTCLKQLFKAENMTEMPVQASDGCGGEETPFPVEGLHTSLPKAIQTIV